MDPKSNARGSTDTSLAALTDPELVEALGQGSDRAAKIFVTMHAPWMLAVARRILRDGPLAEDCVQETFSSAFTNIEKFEGRSTLKTWLHRIVVNKCLMALRSSRRNAEDQLDEFMPQCDGFGCRIEDLWPRLLSVDEIIEQDQLRQMVRKGVDRLPDNFRIVLILRDIEGLSTAEVADELGLSHSNVKVRLHRGRSALKKILEPVLSGHSL